jgi:hypothetical protein
VALLLDLQTQLAEHARQPLPPSFTAGIAAREDGARPTVTIGTFVDVDGFSIAEYPAAVLRTDTDGRRTLTPRTLAALIGTAPRTSTTRRGTSTRTASRCRNRRPAIMISH